MAATRYVYYVRRSNGSYTLDGFHTKFMVDEGQDPAALWAAVRPQSAARGDPVVVAYEPHATWVSLGANTTDAWATHRLAVLREEGKALTNAATPQAIPGPRKPPPALPPEVHRTAPFDADKAWEAVVHLSKGV